MASACVFSSQPDRGRKQMDIDTVLSSNSFANFNSTYAGVGDYSRYKVSLGISYLQWFLFTF